MLALKKINKFEVFCGARKKRKKPLGKSEEKCLMVEKNG